MSKFIVNTCAVSITKVFIVGFFTVVDKSCINNAVIRKLRRRESDSDATILSSNTPNFIHCVLVKTDPGKFTICRNINEIDDSTDYTSGWFAERGTFEIGAVQINP